MGWRNAIAGVGALALIASLAACVAATRPPAGIELERISGEYSAAQGNELRREIDRLDEMVKRSQDGVDPVTHLRLSYLYSHHRNASPDFARALLEFEEYLSRTPGEGRTEIIRYWYSLLREMRRREAATADLKEKMEQLKRDIPRLEREKKEMVEKMEQLKRDISRLEREKKEMVEKMEKLKELDIELEEKRKQVR